MPKGNILVVDDNLNLLEIIKMRLEAADYDVTAVQTAEIAIDAVKSQTYDLAVVDLMLGEQSGISLMEELNKIDPELPVIILTAYDTIETAVEAIQKGGFTYLRKSIDDLQNLLVQIERALQNRRLNVEIKQINDLLEE